MGKVSSIKWNHEVFGNCVKLTNGIIELVVTLDFGPRVIHFSLVGKENMFYEDQSKGTMGETYKEFGGETIRLYGGHRVWISPEVMPRCYYPDCLPVEMEEIENGAVFTAPVEVWNHIQKSIKITLSEDSSHVKVENFVKNVGAWDIEFSVWCITMMAQGGKEVIKQPSRQSGYLHNRTMSLWPYSEMNDERVFWGKEFITLTQDPTKQNAFKFGINNEHNFGAYFNKHQLFIKTFDTKLDGKYPDNGCSYETFTNGAMLEIETLSELVRVAPYETACQTENWYLHPVENIPSNDEDELKQIMSKYI